MEDEEGEKFENWKVSELRTFLSAREVPVSDQPKAELVRNCYVAVSLGLQPKKSVEKYSGSILRAKQEKLILDAGVIRLPNPDTLTDGWEDSTSSLPSIIQSGTENYFDFIILNKFLTCCSCLRETNFFYTKMTCRNKAAFVYPLCCIDFTWPGACKDMTYSKILLQTG